MSDIFKDMQANVGCDYISNLPSYKRKVWHTVKVYVDADGDMVIVQNPTLAPAVEKSDYEPKTPEADASVDADTVNDATGIKKDAVAFFK